MLSTSRWALPLELLAMLFWGKDSMLAVCYPFTSKKIISRGWTIVNMLDMQKWHCWRHVIAVVRLSGNVM